MGYDNAWNLTRKIMRNTAISALGELASNVANGKLNADDAAFSVENNWRSNVYSVGRYLVAGLLQKVEKADDDVDSLTDRFERAANSVGALLKTYLYDERCEWNAAIKALYDRALESNVVAERFGPLIEAIVNAGLASRPEITDWWYEARTTTTDDIDDRLLKDAESHLDETRLVSLWNGAEEYVRRKIEPAMMRWRMSRGSVPAE